MDWFDCHDPVGALIAVCDDPNASHSITVGIVENQIVFTDPDQSVLVVGPPQGLGKTSGVLAPALISHRGPAIAISTKADLATISALCRARQGPVYQYAPTGRDIIPGAIQLRWSPVGGDWETCLKRAQMMVKTAGIAEGRQSSRFWEMRAADLLAVLLFYASRNGLDIEWVVNVVNGFDLIDVIKPIHENLLADGHTSTANLLRGIMFGNDRTTPDIFATASTVLHAYLLPSVLESAKDPNVDFAEMVVGEPDALNDLLHPGYRQEIAAAGINGLPRLRGRFPTVYIVADQNDMEMVAPLIQGLLADWRQAAYDRHRADMMAGTGPRRPPTLCVIDELASCPIPDLPAVLRDSSSQNFLLITALQDFSQTVRWGDEGKALKTLFPNLVVMPGIRDVDTLRDLSALVGEFDKPVWAGSYSFDANKGRRYWNPSLSYQRMPRLPVEDIYRGHPSYPDTMALIFTARRGGWGWLQLMFTYKGMPMPVAIEMNAELALQQPSIWRLGLPFPDLDRNGNVSHLVDLGPSLARSYMETKQKYLALQRTAS